MGGFQKPGKSSKMESEGIVGSPWARVDHDDDGAPANGFALVMVGSLLTKRSSGSRTGQENPSRSGHQGQGHLRRVTARQCTCSIGAGEHVVCLFWTGWRVTALQRSQLALRRAMLRCGKRFWENHRENACLCGRNSFTMHFAGGTGCKGLKDTRLEPKLPI